MAGIDDFLSDGEAPSSGSIDSWLDEKPDAAKVGLAFDHGLKKTPEQSAKLINLSSKTGLATDLVERNTDTIDYEAKRSEFDSAKFTRQKPFTAAWIAQHPNYASLAQDDLPALSKIEQKVSDYTAWQQFNNIAGSTLTSAAATLTKVPSLAADVFTQYQNLKSRGFNAIAEATGSDARRDMIKTPEEFLDNEFVKGYETKAKAMQDKVPELSENVWDAIAEGKFSTAGEAFSTTMTAGKIALIQAVNSAPNLAVMFAMGRAGAMHEALAYAGVTTAADAAAENKNNPEMSPEMGFVNAYAKGGFEAAMERIGTFLPLKHWEDAITRNSGKAVTREVFKDLFKTLLYTTGMNFTEEAATSGAQDLTDYYTGANPDALKDIGKRMFNAGTVGAVMGGAMVAPGAAALATERQGQVKRAQEAKEFYLGVKQAADETKTKDRSPEAQAQLLGTIFKESNNTEVVLSTEETEKYLQSKGVNPVQFMQEIGATEAYEDAKDTGLDLRIPFAQWIDKVPAEHYSGLADDIKLETSREALSLNEVKRLEEADEQAKATEQPEEEAAPLEPEDSAAEIRKNVADQLKAIGVESKQAVLLESSFRAFGEKMKIDPQELFNQFKLRITGPSETPEGAQTFNQDDEVTNARIFKEIEDNYSAPDAIARYDAIPESMGGMFVDADAARSLDPEYASGREGAMRRSSLVDEQAGRFAQKVYENRVRTLPSGPVILLAGGNASGKSTYRSKFGHVWEGATAVFDSSSVNYKFTKQRIELALEYGHPVTMNFIYRSFEDAIEGNKNRFKNIGRLVDPHYIAYTHAGSIDTFLRLNEEYQNNPLVDFEAYDLTSGSPEAISIAKLNKMRYNQNGESVNAAAKRLKGFADERLKDELAEVERAKSNTRGVSQDGANESQVSGSDQGNPGQGDQSVRSIQEDGTKTLKQSALNALDSSTTLAPAFYLKSTQIITQKMGTVVPVAEVRALLKEVKEEERKWSGLDEFLSNKEKAGEKVSKAELLEFLAANQLQIQEVTKSTRSAKEEDRTYSIVEGPASSPFPFVVKNVHGAALESFKTRPEAEVFLESKTSFEDTTKYSQYTVPGGKNYREILFTLPVEDGTPESEVRELEIKDAAAGERKQNAEMATRSVRDDLESAFKKARIKTDEFNRVRRQVGWAVNEIKSEEAREGVLSDLREGLGKKAASIAALDRYITAMKEQKSAFDEWSKIRERFRQIDKADSGKKYRSSHWTEANIVAFVRVSDRIDADGKRVLLADEIQSDWHQEGRKKGYKKTQAELDQRILELQAERQRLDPATDGELSADQLLQRVMGMDEATSLRLKEIDDEIEATRRSGIAGVPDAPFKKTWHEFALKKLIRMAAEGGYDKIAWSGGQIQTDRYDLSKKISKVMYETEINKLYAIDHDGNQIINKKLMPEEVEREIGKDLAQKLLAQPEDDGLKSLEGDAVKVPSPGMMGFYDKIIPDYMRKFGKKYGATVGTSEVATPVKDEASAVRGMTLNDFDKREGMGGVSDRTIYTHRDDSDKYEVYHEPQNVGHEVTLYKNSRPIGIFDSLEQLEQFLAKPVDDQTVKVHSLDITPALKDAALNEGFTLFQKQGDSSRGQIIFDKSGVNIQILKDADLSTFIHELGHFYLEVMQDLSLRDTAPQTIKDDMLTIRNWLGNDGSKFTTDQHEQFARGFEAFTMEGNAPSIKLREAFERFRTWMLQLYKDIKNLNVELTPEVRGVFDRMLATDQEISDAKLKMNTPILFNDPMRMGMSEKAAYDYIAASSAADEQAKSEMNQKLMADLKRQQQRSWLDQLNTIKERITTEVNARPEYIALSILQRGVMPDGSELPKGMQAAKLSRSALIERYGKVKLKELPRPYIYSKEGGLHPDTAAEIFGFKGGDALIQALQKAENKQDLIIRLSDEEMKAIHGDMLTDGRMPEEALKAIHNDRRGELLQRELEILRTENWKVTGEIIRRISRPIPKIDAVRAQAQGMIGKTAIRNIKPIVFERAQSKHAKASVEFFLKGDIDQAFDAKLKELLNFELHRAATQAIEQAESTLDYMRKFRKTTKRQQLGRADYLEQIDSLVNRFEFARVSLKELDRREKTFSEFIQSKMENGESLGEEVYAPDFIKNEGYRKNYRELTHEEMVGLTDSVKQLEHMAIKADKNLATAKKVRREEVKASLISSLIANVKRKPPRPLTDFGMTGGDKTKRALAELDVSLIKMEQAFDWMDGGAIDGPWQTYLFQTASEAQTAEYDYSAKITARIAKLVSGMPKELAAKMREEVVINGIERKLVRRDLIGVALNVGNDSNYQKLLKGHAWSDDQVRTMLDTLTKEEWDFVTGVWDTLETMWPDIAKLQKEMTGLEPDKVAVRPITTKFGTHKGGYYPLMYDPIASAQGELQLSARIGNLLEPGYTKATTPKGHTKSRIEAFSAPIDLDVNNLTSHIAGVIKDLTHRKWAMDANWILSDREVRAAVADHMGPEYVTRLNDWVRQVTNDRNYGSMKSLNIWRKGVEHFRYNAIIAAMGFKVTVMAGQAAGAANSIEAIGGSDSDGVKWFRVGAAKTLRAPMATYEEVIAKSGEMRHRFDTRDRDIRDHLRVLEGRTDLVAQIQETAMQGIGLMEMTISLPTWVAAYEKALLSGYSEEVAIHAGDKAVRLSQGSSGAKDLAAVMAKDDQFMRIMTMFYTPFSAMYSRQRDIGRSIESSKDIPQALLRTFWVVIAGSVLANLAGGHGPDDEKDESWLAWFGKTASIAPFMTVPVLRDVVNAVAGDYGYTFTPLESAIKSAIKPIDTARQVMIDEKEIEDLAADTFKASGYWLGLPTNQLAITGGYIKDMYVGDENPDNLGEFAKNMVMRRKDK